MGKNFDTLEVNGRYKDRDGEEWVVTVAGARDSYDWRAKDECGDEYRFTSRGKFWDDCRECCNDLVERIDVPAQNNDQRLAEVFRRIEALEKALEPIKPQPAAEDKPWYPDGRPWKEHTGTECPVNIGSMCEVLLLCDREEMCSHNRMGFTDEWEWDASELGRHSIVAYLEYRLTDG